MRIVCIEQEPYYKYDAFERFAELAVINPLKNNAGTSRERIWQFLGMNKPESLKFLSFFVLKMDVNSKRLQNHNLNR